MSELKGETRALKLRGLTVFGTCSTAENPPMDNAMITTQESVTPELVRRAYDALLSGDEEAIARYWAAELRWLVPGHNQLSGWKDGREAFLDFMRRVAALSDGSFNMEWIDICVSGSRSADITHNTGSRPGGRHLDIDVVHVLEWRDGKVVEARAAIFGDGTQQYDGFWS
jgi:ketosteroid isomerase-like protein